MPQQIITFYDGGCPLCRREIEHYRRLDHAHVVRWIDIDAGDTGLQQFGITREVAMKRFHVMDQSGEMQTGAAAFVALWSVLPGYRWLAGLIRTLRLVPVLERCYAPFAHWRLARRRRTCPV